MILQGDCLEVLKTLKDGSVNCCVTSPPYWGLRDYGQDGQIGLEKRPQDFVQKLVEVFHEVKRVLKHDGTLWLNLGDTYASDTKGGRFKFKVNDKQASNAGSGIDKPFRLDHGLKPKDLCGIPWRVAFALQDDGWYLRNDIIWYKPAPMPESVTDRCTKAHEYIFLMSKSAEYYFDANAIREPYADPREGVVLETRGAQAYNAARGGDRDNSGGYPKTHEGRNKRTVWEVTSQPFGDAHFATFPPKLIEPCILAGAPRGGIVLDPFFGAGTTGLVALKNAREFVGIELNPEYIKIAEKRMKMEDTTPTMFDLSAGL